MKIQCVLELCKKILECCCKITTHHVLTLADGAIILDAANDLTLRGVAAKHGQNKTSIGHEDRLASLHGCGETGVGARELLAGAFEVVIGSEDYVLSLFQVDFLSSFGKEASADFRSFGVEKDAYFCSVVVVFEQIV
jgi:hypothetical protein